MTNKHKYGSASRLARATAWGLARTLALVWLVPAIFYNVDWGVGASLTTNAAAVGMIVGAALFIDVALRRPGLARTPVLIVVAVFLVYGNTKQAVRTLSFGSEVASEARQTKITTASQVASQRSRLEGRRAAQAKVAGEDAAATLEIAVEGLKVAEPQRWRLTNGCAPDKVTTSIDFCLKVAGAKAKVTAAAERDRIDGELARLPTATSGVGEAAPRVADAYVANVMALLAEMGLKPTERLIAAEEAMSRALGLELLAAFGPACWLIFIDTMAGSGVVAARLRSFPRKQKADIQAAPVEPVKADDIDRWIANDLEIHEGAVTSAKVLRSTPGWPADQPGIAENAIWQRLKNLPGVKHDPNNGRPRYFGLRLRTKGPVLAAIDGARI